MLGNRIISAAAHTPEITVLEYLCQAEILDIFISNKCAEFLAFQEKTGIAFTIYNNNNNNKPWEIVGTDSQDTSSIILQRQLWKVKGEEKLL